MKPDNELDSDVVVVGGGPVGMGLAIELGQCGIRVTVVERYSEPRPLPKGQNLTQRTLEHFHFWGAEKPLRAAGRTSPDCEAGGLTAYRTLLGYYSHDWSGGDAAKPHYFTDNERLPQYETERVLRERAAAIPEIKIHYGWQGEVITQDEDTVKLTISSDDRMAYRRIEARYAVGCDGSHSMIRNQSGIEQNQFDDDRLLVLVVFRSEQLHRLLKRYPEKACYHVLHPELDGYRLYFGRVDTNCTWFFHAPVPANTTRQNFDLADCLRRAVGEEVDAQPVHIGFWDLQFAAARTFRKGRVFIAGEAAHSHPPYGGYGINMGFEDARNLGWKLAASVQGWGGDGLLDSYDAERRPVVESTARDFIGRFIERDRTFLRSCDPAQDRPAFETEWRKRAEGDIEASGYVPNYRGSPVVFGPPDADCCAVGDHAFDARPGFHLAPQPLSSGGDIYERLGGGFTLIALGGNDDDVAAFESAAADRGLPLGIIADGFDGGRERLGARLILVRPDQFVAWAGDDLQDGPEPAAILARAAGY